MTSSLQQQPSAFDFAEQIFAHLPRADQRRWAHAYLVSLLRTPGKKSMRRLAATISDSPTAAQSLHQFVNASPWEWEPANQEIMRWAEQQLNPVAWQIDVTVMRKRGEHSCGVHRRFVPDTGRSVNCQVGIGGFLVHRGGAVPVDWRLFLPGAWIRDSNRRARARIPHDVAAQGLEDHALDLARAMSERTRRAAVPVIADLSAHAGAGTLVRGFSRLGCDFGVAVPGNLPLVVGRHLEAPRRDGRSQPVVLPAGKFFESGYGGSLATTICTAPQGRTLTVQAGLVGLPRSGPFEKLPQRTYRLLSVRCDRQSRPGTLWLTNMVHRRIEDVIATVQMQAHTKQVLRDLDSGFGLQDFEGRSYPGWHHHMTLVSAAYVHNVLEHADRQPALAS
ncbi:IS701 family transposase [Streptomyces sp. NPDC053780]|uniref:IS701 family transposase n=1 Tax=unclassified Streptomyces TaxID=2593676 RepID=UPI000F74B8D2|nr:transposase [Streptomyces sp. WAC 04229]RSN62120.1 transcriptional regulator [Streptomyces sp. WAC 04229]